MEASGHDYSEIIDQCYLLIEQGKTSEDIDDYLSSLSLDPKITAKVIFDIQDFQVEHIKTKQQKDKANTYYLLGGACMLCAVMLQAILLFAYSAMTIWLVFIFAGGYLLLRKGRRVANMEIQAVELNQINKEGPLRDRKGKDIFG